MLDIGWTELLLIGIVALIVVGPEDLPRMFRALGRMTARARGMAREFSHAMEDAARSSGLDEAGKTLQDVKSLTSKKSLGLDALDRAATSFEKWDPKRPTRASSRTPGAKPDPAAPAKADSTTGNATTGSDAPATAQSPAPKNADTPQDVDTSQDASTAQGAPPVTEAPGKRQLRATRRSDRAPAPDIGPRE